MKTTKISKLEKTFTKPEADSGKGRVTIRCTVEEFKWLNKNKKKYGLTRAGFVKRKAFDYPLTLIPK